MLVLLRLPKSLYKYCKDDGNSAAWLLPGACPKPHANTVIAAAQ